MTGIDRAPQPSTGRVGRELAGRYRLTRPIATGGMAEVWQAEDTVLNRSVAVKILHRHLAADPVFLERFRAEARLAARLSDPGIVSIFDTVSEPDIEAIVMELLEGVDLRSFLDEHGPLSPMLTRELGVQVANAIAAAHNAGLVHRDIKPANIMLVDDRRMKVTDFGIAKPDDGHDLTDHGTLIGTAKYLAPEQVSGGPVDGRADIYSLGVVLFECLTGTAPFSGETSLATALARLHKDPPHARSLRSTVPPSLDDVVHRAMARRPDERFSSAADLRAALLVADDATVLSDAPLRARDHQPAPAPVEFIVAERRWIVPTVLIVVIAVALAIAGALVGTTDVGRGAVTRAREVVGLDRSDPVPTAPPSPGDDTGRARIVAVRTFDPEGTGAPGENDDAVHLVVDGDPGTSWSTEGYDSRHFGGLKSGVGLVLDLSDQLTDGVIEVAGPSLGWSVEVYVASSAAEDLRGWGAPVAAVSGVDGSPVRIDLADARGSAVLLWITDLGDAADRARVQIDEIALLDG